MIIVILFVVVTFIIAVAVNIKNGEDLGISILLGILFSLLAAIVGCLFSLIGRSVVGYEESLYFREVISVKESNVVYTEKNKEIYAMLILANGDLEVFHKKQNEIKGDKNSNEIFIIHDIIKKECRYKYVFLNPNVEDESKFYLYKGKIED